MCVAIVDGFNRTEPLLADHPPAFFGHIKVVKEKSKHVYEKCTGYTLWTIKLFFADVRGYSGGMFE